MKNQIDPSTPFLAFYDLLRIRGVYSTEEKREKLRRGFHRAMALAAVLVGLVLPQSARASALGDIFSANAVDGNLPAGSYSGAAGSFMDGSENNGNGVTITGSDPAVFRTDGAWSVDGGSLTYDGGNIFLLAPGGITFNGGSISADTFVAAAMGSFSFGSAFRADDVEGPISGTGTAISAGTKVFIGTTVDSGLGGTQVGTDGMIGDSEITIASGGGTITFKGTMGDSSVLKAGTVKFDDVDAETKSTANGTVDAGTSGTISGNFTQSGGEMTAGTVGAAGQTIKQNGGTINSAKIDSVLTQGAAGTINAGSATATLNVGAGSTLGAGSVNAGTIKVGSDGSGALTLAGNQLNDKTVNAGAVTIAGAADLEYNVRGNISSVGTSGNAAGKVTVNNGKELTLGAIEASSLDVTAGGAVTQSGAANVSGAAKVTAQNTAGTTQYDVTLTQADNKFGTVGATGANVSITESDAVALDAVTATGTLTVNAGGAVTQNDAANVNVKGATSVTVADGSDVTLGNAGNQFSSVGVVGKTANTGAAGAVTVVDSDSTLALNAVRASGLTVTAAGNVTQTAAANVTGAATVTAEGSNVTLTQADNKFGTVGATGANVSITESDAVALDAVTATGTLTVNAGGAVTQNDAANVTGAATITATGNDITLTNDNEFGSVGATGKNVSIKESDGVKLNAVTTTGTLTVNAGGAVTQTAAAKVAGKTTVTASGNNVTLSQANNDFNAIEITGKAVSVTDSTGDIDLKDVSASDSITANATHGTVTKTGGPIETGALDVTAGDGRIELTTKVESVKAQASGSVKITDTSDAAAGRVLTVNGAKSGAAGDVEIVSENNGVVVASAVSAGTGTGGKLVISGAEINASVTAGGADRTVKIQGQSPDIILGANFGSDADTINLSANRDIVVKNNNVTVAGKTVTLTANKDGIVGTGEEHAGGVYIAGTVRAADGDAIISGKELHWVAAPDAAKQKGVYFDDGTVEASGNITVLDKSGENTVPFQTGAMSLTARGGKVNLGGGDAPSGIEKEIQSSGDVTISQKNELSLTKAVSTGNAKLNLESTDGAVTLGTITAGSLTINAAGAVTQTAAATVTGAASVTATGKDITLTQADNKFRSIGATGANVEIKEADGVVLSATAASGTLKVTGGGAITQSGDVSATGATTLDAGANAITLNSDRNDFGGTVTVANTPSGVNIHDRNALDVAAVTTSGSATLQAGGALTTQAVAANGGSATLKGGTVTTGGAVSAKSDASLDAKAGAVKTGGTVTGRDVSVTATAGANTTAGAVTAGRNATIDAGNGAARVAEVTASAGNIEVSGRSVSNTGAVKAEKGTVALVGGAGGTTVGGNVTAGGNAVIVSDGGAATINAGNTVRAANLGIRGAAVANNGTIEGVNQLAIVQTGGAAMTLTDDDIPAGAQTVGIQSAGDLTVDSTHDLVFGTATVRVGDRTVIANGLASTAGSVDVSSDGSIRSSAITGAAGTTVETRNGGAIDVAGNLGQGGDTVVNANGAAVNAGTLASGGALDVNNAGAVTADIAAGGDARIQSGSLEAAQTQAGGNLVLEVGGDANVGQVAVGGDVNGAVGGVYTVAGGNVGTMGQGGDFTTGEFQLQGDLASGDVTMDAGTLQMDGNLDAAGAAVDITAGGGIQGGGVLTAGQLSLAGGAIGAAGAAFQVNTATLQNIAGTGIYLVDTAAGTIAINVIDASGALDLNIPNAAVAGGGSVSAGGDMTLTVNQQFGTLANPVNISVGGTLTIDGVGVPLLHIAIDGNADPNDLTILYNAEGFAIWGNAQKGYQIVGVGPEQQLLINRALAFTVNTPELKSKQGVFGDPAFVHTKMNVSEARSVANMDILAVNSVDYHKTWNDILFGAGATTIGNWNPAVDTTDEVLDKKLNAQDSEMESLLEVWVPSQTVKSKDSAGTGNSGE